MTIKFTKKEWEELNLAREELTRRSVKIPNRTRRDLTKTQAEADDIGLVGEYAVAKLFGLPLSACGMLLKGIAKDEGYDLIFDGRTIQVKTIERKSFSSSPFWFALETTNIKEFKADYGVLVYWFPNDNMEIAGCISREEFVAKKEIVNLGTGKRLGIRSDRLRPIEDYVCGLSHSVMDT